jgi:hypothetical protein
VSPRGACAALALLAALGAAAPADGAVTLGATDADFAASGGGSACTNDPCAYYQVSHPLGRVGVSPFDGIVVRWRIRVASLIAAANAKMSLRLVGPATGPLVWGAQGPEVDVPDAPQLPATVSQDLRMPIGRGQGIAPQFGSLSGGSVFITTVTMPGAAVRNISPPPGPGETGDGPTTVDRLLAIAADIETDADRDQFGDESQDACPTNAATQGACPPADPGDITAPQLVWCGKRRQNVLGPGAATACVRGNELAAVTATGSLAIPGRKKGGASTRVALRGARGAVASGSRAVLQLKLGRRARAKVRAARRLGRRVSGRVSVTGTDAAGNSSTVSAAIVAR